MTVNKEYFLTMNLTISNAGTTVTVHVVPGTLTLKDQPSETGGGSSPSARTHQSVSGSCSVFMDENLSCRDVLNLISPAGEGSVELSGPVFCTHALLDAEISGNGLPIVTFFWKGIS